jgi:hypothetical protein
MQISYSMCLMAGKSCGMPQGWEGQA